MFRYWVEGRDVLVVMHDELDGGMTGLVTK